MILYSPSSSSPVGPIQSFPPSNLFSTDFYFSFFLPPYLPAVRKLRLIAGNAKFLRLKSDLQKDFEAAKKRLATFPPRESLVSDIPAGDGNVANLFLQCGYLFEVPCPSRFVLGWVSNFVDSESGHILSVKPL
jgi:hypothetical protein